MPVLATDVFASSAPYRRARTRMQTLLAEVTDLQNQVAQGSDASVQRHRDRGKLPVRDRIALLIDGGYLNTEISVVEGDAITYHAMLPMGGGQITAEICEELRIPMRAAEQIKRSYVFNPDEFDQDAYSEVYDERGERLSFPRDYVQRPVEKSVDELSDMIDLTLKNDAANFLGPRSQVFLTGGGIALMRGGREYLAAKIGRPVKVPVAKSAKMNSPVYASALGLVDLIFDSIEQQGPKESGGIKKLKGWFK